MPRKHPQVLGADLKRSERWSSFISKGFYSPGFRVLAFFINSARQVMTEPRLQKRIYEYTL